MRRIYFAPVTLFRCRIILVLYLKIHSILTAPMQIVQAKPQVMMHTLQQPSPIETLQSLKSQKLHQDLQASTRLQQLMMANLQQQMATNTLQELAKIQAMQYMRPNPMEIQSPMLVSTWSSQVPLESMQTPWQPEIIEGQHQIMPMMQQMTEETMQEIALQQQMLALQQMQAFNQLNTVHSPYTYPQPEPVLILLPDEKTENTEHKFYKNTNDNNTKEDEYTDHEHGDEDLDSVILESSDETKPYQQKGIRKAILLIPNARISIGGVISQIPWLPVEVNVPDTAIWAWNGIYNGISSIISIIGSRLPWRPRPQDSADTTSEPSVKHFLENLQRKDYDDYGPMIPAYPVPLDPLNAVIPVNFN